MEIEKQKTDRKEDDYANQLNQKRLREEKENRRLKEEQAKNKPPTPKKDHTEEEKSLSEDSDADNSIELQDEGIVLTKYNTNATKGAKSNEKVDKELLNRFSTKYLDQPKTFNKQANKTNPKDDQPKTFKRLSTEEYESRVISISELDLEDKFKFVTNPPPVGRVVQVSVFRDRKGIKNSFYPKYHVSFSVL